MASFGQANPNDANPVLSASVVDDASTLSTTQPDLADLDLTESPGDDGPAVEAPQSARSRARSSRACVMCQRKKIRCTGAQPCENCQRRRWSCRFDAEGDGRKKASNHRVIQELNEANEQLKRHRQMISGFLAIIRAGESQTVQEFIDEVRRTEKVGDVATFIRAKIDRDERLLRAFDRVDWSPDPQL
ncbi:hypothetical protein, variant 4 [Exophiala oligosperma]|uniref:Zn(2)-C6 fungal-type domain-containing protein n=2 Tax=Chaetothyriales TaxID=34395 RepID=A0A0D2AF49_9EURO|nr:uncharacterized protein PV06_08669 [Exophiala oligosperma]XP_016259048.1 hypothetical protein, variant 1 [Exophiala oligosperma]XP_016259049.1 hypothetical protein, variant 2 [Exophiala oligosperma]XP_016259050.1 hypothetical protein, variant 3 [Exophiala oligosperma]XP_016259051.1 hypothetical protein, variant 4 [Exophiala oligosperma]KAJ9634956.1 hypothetical protein H2204_005911 [Knufia peltigerae]KIW38831.1 hypothetical protein PV06_08669 [Exophiala oligosperma]KIW38832.1 hypothetical